MPALRPFRAVSAGMLFFVLFGLSGEIAVRFVLPEYDVSRHVRFLAETNDRPPLGPTNEKFRMVKNTGDYDISVVFNAHGLRDPKDIAHGTIADLYLVGDSFTFGWGNEEKVTVSAQLEQLMGRRVFNLSVTGHIQTYERLLDYAISKGAEIRQALVFVTMENDLMSYATVSVSPDAPVPKIRTLPGFFEIKYFLTTHSALYLAATSFIQQTSWLRDLAVRAGLIIPNLQGIHAPIQSDQIVEESAERLALIGKRFDITAVLIPSRALWHGSEQANAVRIHDRFLAALHRRGVKTIDLRPAFERDGSPLSLHFLNDGHWNPAGHRRAAETVAAYLAQQRHR